MNADRLLNLFCELVRIESPSRHEAAMAARCEVELTDLGFAVEYDESAPLTGSDTGNLIAVRKGEVAGTLILSAHMDTVDPCAGIDPVVCDGVIYSAGDTILSADDKSGIAPVFEAIRSLIEQDEPLPEIWVLLTTCEELHLLGAGALDADRLPLGASCYVLDADGPAGTIIQGAPCHYTFEATFHGMAAHAGVEPERGVSAILMAADAVAHMPLGRLDENTTANVGIISGGGATNVVPETCVVSGECRSLSTERADAVREAITGALAAASERAGGSVDVQWRVDYPAVVYAEDDPLVQGVVMAAKAAGLTPQLHYSGGGADANIHASRGVRAITLSTGMANFHSTEEYISIADLEGTCRLVEELIRGARL